jgi:hypothetical protein
LSTTVVGNPVESTWPHYVVTNSDGPGLEALGRVLGLCWSGVTWEVCKTDAGKPYVHFMDRSGDLSVFVEPSPGGRNWLVLDDAEMIAHGDSAGRAAREAARVLTSILSRAANEAIFGQPEDDNDTIMYVEGD